MATLRVLLYRFISVNALGVVLTLLSGCIGEFYSATPETIIKESHASYPLSVGTNIYEIVDDNVLWARVESEEVKDFITTQHKLKVARGIPVASKKFGTLSRIGACYVIKRDNDKSIYFMVEHLKDKFYLVNHSTINFCDNKGDESKLSLTGVFYLDRGAIWAVDFDIGYKMQWEQNLNRFWLWWYDIEASDSEASEQKASDGKKRYFYSSTKGIRSFLDNEEAVSLYIPERPMYSIDAQFAGEDILFLDDIINSAKIAKNAALLNKQRAERERRHAIEQKLLIEEQMQANQRQLDALKEEQAFHQRYARGTLWYVEGMLIDDKVIIVGANYATKRVTVRDTADGKVFDVYADKLITTGSKNMKDLGRAAKFLCALSEDCRNKSR